MIRIVCTILFLALSSQLVHSQEIVSVKLGEETLVGTLLSPEESKTVVLIISGSGKTDRDGNTRDVTLTYVNDCLKQLAEQLEEKGIASLRYDKRGVGESLSENYDVKNLRFNQYVDDALKWVEFLEGKYDKIVIAGHSQGGLVGMLTCQKAKIDKFISIAGLAKGLYQTLHDQLSNQPAFVTQAAIPLLDSLYQGHYVYNVPQYLNSIFNRESQDYLMSFLHYDPQEEIKKLKIPILVLNGTHDLQISVEDAKMLSEQNKKAKFVSIEGVNHVLKESPLEKGANVATYNDPGLQINATIVQEIVNFIK